MCPGDPKWGRELFFPGQSRPCQHFGRHGFWWFWFWEFLCFGFFWSQISSFPGPRFPNFQKSGLGPAWAQLGPGLDYGPSTRFLLFFWQMFGPSMALVGVRVVGKWPPYFWKPLTCGYIAAGAFFLQKIVLRFLEAANLWVCCRRRFFLRKIAPICLEAPNLEIRRIPLLGVSRSEDWNPTVVQFQLCDFIVLAFACSASVPRSQGVDLKGMDAANGRNIASGFAPAPICCKV